MARRPHPAALERRFVAPVPTIADSLQQAAAAVAAPAAFAAADPAPVARPSWPDPLRRGVNIDALSEPDLRSYAKHIGLSPRDCQGLAVERLRVNCKAHIHDLIEQM